MIRLRRLQCRQWPTRSRRLITTTNPDIARVSISGPHRKTRDYARGAGVASEGIRPERDTYDIALNAAVRCLPALSHESRDYTRWRGNMVRMKKQAMRRFTWVIVPIALFALGCAEAPATPDQNLSTTATPQEIQYRRNLLAAGLQAASNGRGPMPSDSPSPGRP